MTDRPTPVDWRCQVCRRTYAKDQPNQTCADCQRLRAYGALVTLAMKDFFHWPDHLDAIATLMGTATRLRRQHTREMVEEQRGAQRDARAAYDDGEAAGRQEGRSW